LVAATGAVAPEVGIAADLTGVENCEVLDAVDLAAPVGEATALVGVAAPVDEPTGLVTVGLDRVAVAVADAWPSGGAVDWLGVLALAVCVT
jgi:hypothetical protein